VRTGDVVEYKTWYWEDDPEVPDDFKRGLGTVLEIKHWVDSGAPDRNFGTHITVLWPNGSVEIMSEEDLEVVSSTELG